MFAAYNMFFSLFSLIIYLKNMIDKFNYLGHMDPLKHENVIIISINNSNFVFFSLVMKECLVQLPSQRITQRLPQIKI